MSKDEAIIVKKERLFTLRQMLECWDVSQDSWAKECGEDVSDLEDAESGYIVPINKKAWFKERFDIELKH